MGEKCHEGLVQQGTMPERIAVRAAMALQPLPPVGVLWGAQQHRAAFLTGTGRAQEPKICCSQAPVLAKSNGLHLPAALERARAAACCSGSILTESLCQIPVRHLAELHSPGPAAAQEVIGILGAVFLWTNAGETSLLEVLKSKIASQVKQRKNHSTSSKEMAAGLLSGLAFPVSPEGNKDQS
ncbi:hypothetical protein Anapl_04354 [Anas platyrhynchos]|uniref:Uncharacterized protein n=1 Tax=Anas platyrhynchos TaxID=8839 RepID=R0JPB8_ANAPL|nr:hypothetical protein Anapl_04354 [Anas platyrhynchos]